MTRKDFELLARIIHMLPLNTTRQQVAEIFAAELQATNPAFNQTRFIGAATRTSRLTRETS